MDYRAAVVEDSTLVVEADTLDAHVMLAAAAVDLDLSRVKFTDFHFNKISAPYYLNFATQPFLNVHKKLNQLRKVVAGLEILSVSSLLIIFLIK